MIEKAAGNIGQEIVESKEIKVCPLVGGRW